MGLKVGICGAGAFADSFIPLFKAHPLVEDVVLADINAEKLKAKAEQFEIQHTLPSLEALCESDVDAIAIFTQHWLHGPQAVQALRAGKDVYSAVPPGITVEEVAAIIQATKESGRIYMLGETSYYYSTAIYCRKRFQQGDFGRIVYSEGEYYHDIDHGLYEVLRWRGGERWREIAGMPPMYYPTHSTGLIISVTRAHAVSVSCLGFEDNHPDGLYRPEVNIWQNSFSNETALFRMSDGSIMRINEFRRIGHPGIVGLSIYGTEASFEERAKSQVWLTKDHSQMEDVTELLACVGVPRPRQTGNGMSQDTPIHAGLSRVHDVERLPEEFIGLPTSHSGSHQFLVDDFVKACVERVHPPCNAWEAARYVLPGIIAHESAKREGALLEVPDFGDCPYEVVYF